VYPIRRQEAILDALTQAVLIDLVAKVEIRVAVVLA
jgi:hypothetical protein